MTASGKVIVVGTVWHRDDVLSTLAARSDWRAFRFPITTDAGESNWPERWPGARIDKVREQLGPFDSARALDLVPLAEESAPLKWEWIANALHKGAELVAHESILCPPATFRMSIGVDPAVSLQSGSDLSAIVTIGRTRTARSK